MRLGMALAAIVDGHRTRTDCKTRSGRRTRLRPPGPEWQQRTGALLVDKKPISLRSADWRTDVRLLSFVRATVFVRPTVTTDVARPVGYRVSLQDCPPDGLARCTLYLSVASPFRLLFSDFLKVFLASLDVIRANEWHSNLFIDLSCFLVANHLFLVAFWPFGPLKNTAAAVAFACPPPRSLLEPLPSSAFPCHSLLGCLFRSPLMADISEEADCAAASAEFADSDDLAADVVTPPGLAPGPASPPDVGAIRAALEAVVMEKDHVHVENSLLSDHLMRLMMRSGSGESMQMIQLESLEELDEVYEEVEENQGFFPAGRTSSAHMSFNIPSPSSDGRLESGTYRPSWMRSAHEMAQGLSMEERCDIAAAETKFIQDQMHIYRDESERMLDELRAAYDEAELRIGEIRRDISDFRREVLAEAAERGAKTASSEHVLKFLQQKIKSTRFTIEKLRERNATLHGNIAKTEATLEVKKDLADVLHAVDFDQLAIQKQQLETQLRDHDKEVLRLKGENLKTEKVLEKAHAQLNLLSEQHKVIKETLIERKPQLLSVKDDIAEALEQKAKAQEVFVKFVKERESSQGEKKPSVMEYLGLKKKVSDLQQFVHAMQTKVEVGDLTATQLGVKLREATRFSKK